MDQGHRCAENVLNFKTSVIINTYSTFSSISASVLKEKYVEKQLSMRDIAKEFSCSKTQVRNLLLQNNIEIRKPNNYHKVHERVYGKKRINGKVVDHKKEQRVLDTIKKMYEEGVHPRAMARLLDAMKIPTKNQGKGWHHHTIITMLKREGLYESKKKQ